MPAYRNTISDPMPACRIRDLYGAYPGQHLGSYVEGRIADAQREGVKVRLVERPSKHGPHIHRIDLTLIPECFDPNA